MDHALGTGVGVRWWLATPLGTRVVVFVMACALVVGFRASDQLPITVVGFVLFGGCALLRPDLALLFIPLTVPLFFMPKGVWDARFGIRDSGIRVPLHEVVLLITFGCVVVRGAWRRWSMVGVWGARGRDWAGFIAPYMFPALFLLAGTLGVVVAPASGRAAAIREWRWLIVEPLLFYGSVKYLVACRLECSEGLLHAFLISGALVGLLGLLQAQGFDLVPLLGTKVGFSDNQIAVEGVQRVSSVYGHPNNLGLFMDRVWPLAAALTLGVVGQVRWRWQGVFFGGGTLLALGGMVVSFSKGALLGGMVAAIVLLPLLRRVLGWRWRWLLGAGGVALVLAFGGALLLGVERMNPFGVTSAIRLHTWGSALAMLRDHPVFGIGLDQFGTLYPGYIDPALAQTNERFTSHPHMLFLDIWLRMGVLGLVAFAGLCWRMGRLLLPLLHGETMVPWGVGIAAAMCAALFHGFVDNFYFVPDLAFAFWLFLAWAEMLASTDVPI